jgi:hypothetical protein
MPVSLWNNPSQHTSRSVATENFPSAKNVRRRALDGMLHLIRRLRSRRSASVARVCADAARLLFLLMLGIGALLPSHLGATVPEERDYLVVTGGAGEILGSHKIPVFGAEYRFKENYRGLHPYLLGARGTDGSSYAGAGLLYNFAISPRWRLTASSQTCI